jgi:23S rRNA (guanine745-N1)-methyltransferase
LIVSPGPRHLWQIKQMIYTDPQHHDDQIKTPDGFALRYINRLDYELLLPDQSAVQQLLHMTPFYWHMTPDLQESFAALERFNTTVDFHLHVFEKQV